MPACSQGRTDATSHSIPPIPGRWVFEASRSCRRSGAATATPRRRRLLTLSHAPCPADHADALFRRRRHARHAVSATDVLLQMLTSRRRTRAPRRGAPLVAGACARQSTAPTQGRSDEPEHASTPCIGAEVIPAMKSSCGSGAELERGQLDSRPPTTAGPPPADDTGSSSPGVERTGIGRRFRGSRTAAGSPAKRRQPEPKRS